MATKKAKVSLALLHLRCYVNGEECQTCGWNIVTKEGHGEILRECLAHESDCPYAEHYLDKKTEQL